MKPKSSIPSSDAKAGAEAIRANGGDAISENSGPTPDPAIVTKNGACIQPVAKGSASHGANGRASSKVKSGPVRPTGKAHLRNGPPASHVQANGAAVHPRAAKDISTIEFHYDKEKRHYWRKTPNGDFVLTTAEDLKKHCRIEEIDVDTWEPGLSRITKFEVATTKKQNFGVDSVIALAGHRSGVFEPQDGRKILVPKSPKLDVPQRGGFLNFETFLTELLGTRQMPYALGWLKIALEDLRSFNPYAWRHNQMMVLVGEARCGKSFFQKLITILLGGRENDPYLWMVGKTDFNEHLASAEHLAMGDKQPFRDTKSRGNFAAKVKELTVNSEMAIHGKGKTQFNAPCFRRLSLSANPDSDYLTVVPMLDRSVADKLMVFQCSKAKMVDDFGENLMRFKREAGAFAYYLLEEFDLPEGMRDQRFGVKSYLNPEVVELLEEFEPHLKFLALVDGTLFVGGKRDPVAKTAEEIHTLLADGPLKDQARLLLSSTVQCGLQLKNLSERIPTRFSKAKSNGRKIWTINPPEE